MSKYLIFYIIFEIFISFSLEVKEDRVKQRIKEESQNENVNIKPPSFSKISGFYPGNFKLQLSSEDNSIIYYTMDSTDPRTSSSSKEYKDYILIYDKSSEPNIYSSIGANESSPVSISHLFEYIGPNFPLDKAMIIRAVTKNSNGEFSEIKAETYFITNENLYEYQDLTVVSIITNPENLFDPDIGIYVTGTSYQKAKDNSEDFEPWMKSNYFQKGKEWEREAFITIFDKGEINVQQNVGIRIKGAFTRGNPGKSFNIYARKKYGKSTIETNLLKDNYDLNGNLITSYKSLSLRNIYDEGRLRDKFGRDLFYMREGLTTPNMANSILFLNGEYWGFYLIQEKLDNDFISQNYLLPKNNIVIAKAYKLEDGPEKEFEDFNNFCNDYSLNDVSDKKIYSEIGNYIDLNSLIELFATGLYVSNLDWPGNNDGEWRYFGEPIEGNIFSDGKWRFIIYDLDYSMGAPFLYPHYAAFVDFGFIERRKPISPVNLFIALLKNNIDFQYKFINTICDYANEVYSKEKIKQLIEKYKEEYTDIIANSQLRWCGYDYDSKLEEYAYYKTEYIKALDSIISFFENRPKQINNYMMEYLQLSEELVELTIKIRGKGKIQINSIIPEFINNEWTGKYYTRIPIKIKALPDIGYNFINWSGYIDSIEQIDEIILFKSQEIIATFD